MKKDKEESETTRTEYDEGRGSDWKEYEIKTIATAVKYKWKLAMDARVISPKTKEQVAAEAAGRCWFIMTCKDDALEYIRMHAEDGCTNDMWKELKDRYDVVRKDDLTNLYTNFTETVNAGPSSDDPKLWFKKIEHMNKKVKKAARQLKEDVALIALTIVPLTPIPCGRAYLDSGVTMVRNFAE
jgi:hypothetical protein